MAIRKEDLHQLVDRLREMDQKTVYDFMKYLIDRAENQPDYWKQINQADPDDEPLTEQEARQLQSEEGYVSGEDAKREFGIQVDLP